MQKFWAVLGIFLIFSMSIDTADARRFGGGKSFGKIHKTQPAAQRKAAPANQQPTNSQQATANKPAAGAAGTAAKGGIFGGLMGGLLAGGLFAYLLGSGAFEGIEFIDILILGLLAFFVFRFLRSRASPATANSASSTNSFTAKEDIQQNSAFTSSAGFATAALTDVPLNLPVGFNEQEFLTTAQSHYYTLQEAWNNSNFSIIQDYLAPGLLKNLQLERQDLPSQLNTQVEQVSAQIVRADYNTELAELSLHFSGDYKDELNGEAGAINDIWHLERDLTQANQPWLIVGIESSHD